MMTDVPKGRSCRTQRPAAPHGAHLPKAMQEPSEIGRPPPRGTAAHFTVPGAGKRMRALLHPFSPGAHACLRDPVGLCFYTLLPGHPHVPGTRAGPSVATVSPLRLHSSCPFLVCISPASHCPGQPLASLGSPNGQKLLRSQKSGSGLEGMRMAGILGEGTRSSSTQILVSGGRVTCDFKIFGHSVFNSPIMDRCFL